MKMKFEMLVIFGSLLLFSPSLVTADNSLNQAETVESSEVIDEIREETTESSLNSDDSTDITIEEEIISDISSLDSESIEIEVEKASKTNLLYTIEEVNLYGTVIDKNDVIWQDKELTQENYSTKEFFNQTLLIKERIIFSNGQIYYELTDNKQNKLGYTQEKNLSISSQANGKYFNNGMYGTILKKNYSFWQNFSFSKERHSSNQYLEETLLVKGEYHHFNGETYYSVYDNKNYWVGYINSNGVSLSTHRGGQYFSKGRYGTVLKRNYSFWQDFNFSKERHNSNQFFQNTLLVKGEYHHFNGSRYYSVYDNKNNWIGYINQQGITLGKGREGVGIAISQSVALPSNNYPIWQNFSWVKRSNTNQLAKKKYLIKYQYHHFNGSVYDSIYDGNNWIGYLNQSGSRKWEVRSGVTYIDNIMVVNKKINLPRSFNPGENQEAGKKIRMLIRDMQSRGMSISSSYSGFRTYDYQKILYDDYVRVNGQKKADTFSARPGYSEHQTGLTFDLIQTDGSLVQNKRESDWIANNAHRYGFIVRYQSNKTSITGYQAEPWHLRYVGENHASNIYRNKQCLEEYLGVLGGDYR